MKRDHPPLILLAELVAHLLVEEEALPPLKTPILCQFLAKVTT